MIISIVIRLIRMLLNNRQAAQGQFSAQPSVPLQRQVLSGDRRAARRARRGR